MGSIRVHEFVSADGVIDAPVILLGRGVMYLNYRPAARSISWA